MLAVFESSAILFIFITLGFILGKAKIVKNEHSQILSKLLVYVFLPCNVFKTFLNNFEPAKLKSGYEYIILSVIILVGMLIFAYFAAKPFSKESYERYIYEYSIIIPNYGYMGYALSELLLGEQGCLAFMIFSVPLSLYIHTYGYSRLTKKKFSLKSLIDPTIIATVLGIVAGLLSVSLPEVATEVITKASGCMAPVSMLLSGIVISGFSFKRILGQKKVYILTAIRLVAIPLVLLAVLKIFRVDVEMVKIAVLFYALPCGMNTIIFPRSVNENCEIGAGLALVATALSLVTLPIIMAIAGI